MKAMCVLVKLILTLLFFQVTEVKCSDFLNITEFIDFYQDHPFSNQRSVLNLARFKETAINVQQTVSSVDKGIGTIPFFNETISANQQFKSVMDSTELLCNVTIGLLEGFSDVQMVNTEDRTNLITNQLKRGIVQLKHSRKIEDYEFRADDVKTTLIMIRKSYEKIKHDFDVELQFLINEMWADYYNLYAKKMKLFLEVVPDLENLFADAEKLTVLIVPEIELMKFDFNEHFRLRMNLMNSLINTIDPL